MNMLSMHLITIVISSFILLVGCLPVGIRWLQRLQCQQTVRDDGPQSHLKKNQVPTMAGLFIIANIFLQCLCWTPLANPYVIVILCTLAAYACIGGLDDGLKCGYKNTRGLPGKIKLLLQVIFAGGIYALAQKLSIITPSLYIPLLHQQWIWPQHGLWGLHSLWFILVVVASSNAANLTDGLDGLLAGTLLPIILLWGGCLATQISPETAPMLSVLAAILGSILAFLWYNCHPAQCFMGDIGSLSLGATMGVFALLLKQELIFLLAAAVWVMETLSVMIQVASFRWRKKRVFKMAPIHHHFELLGWSEVKVCIRFWIMAYISLLVALYLWLI